MGSNCEAKIDRRTNAAAHAPARNAGGKNPIFATVNSTTCRTRNIV
ncbi:MAG: hypothetical protein ACRCUY_02110 [Thermoguttaceae bacterium]